MIILRVRLHVQYYLYSWYPYTAANHLTHSKRMTFRVCVYILLLFLPLVRLTHSIVIVNIITINEILQIKILIYVFFFFRADSRQFNNNSCSGILVECEYKLSNARTSLAALPPQMRTIVICDNERVAITALKAVESHEMVYANVMLIKIPHTLQLDLNLPKFNHWYYVFEGASFLLNSLQ